jgi:hypothetical protein
LDALVAALVAVAKHLGWVNPIPSSEVEAAARAGWIWLPTGETLSVVGD